MFWFGDLNFRIEDYDIHVVKCAVDSNKLPLLWERDQVGPFLPCTPHIQRNAWLLLEAFAAPVCPLISANRERYSTICLPVSGGLILVSFLCWLSALQLNMAKNSESILEGFMEGPLKFPPTYKFDVGTNTYDTRFV